MPFIDSKITVPVSNEKREIIKSRLGESISLLHKAEAYLMIGFDDNYDLYMSGKKLEKGAYVSVSLFGNAPSDAYNQMTAAICNILAEELARRDLGLEDRDPENFDELTERMDSYLDEFEKNGLDTVNVDID